MSVVEFQPARLVPHRPPRGSLVQLIRGRLAGDPIRRDVYLVRIGLYPSEKFVAIRAANIRAAARGLGTTLAGIAQLRVRRYGAMEFYRAINNLENGEYAP